MWALVGYTKKSEPLKHSNGRERPMPPFSFILNISWGVQLKHQVKLGGQTKRPWSLLCFRYIRLLRLKKLLFLSNQNISTHTHTHLSISASLHRFHKMPRWRSCHHAAYQEAGGRVSRWTMGGMGETCSWKHVVGASVNFLPSPSCCDGVTAGTLSAVSSRKNTKGQQPGDINTFFFKAGISLARWQLACTVDQFVHCGWKWQMWG